MRRIAAVFLVGGLVACAQTEPTSAPAPQPANHPKQAGRANVVSTPVPYGTKLSCQNLVPASALSELLNRPVVVVSRESKTATATCSIQIDGELPTSRRKQKELAEANHGLLPGDELCELSVQCSYILDRDQEVARCRERGGVIDDEVGEVSCVIPHRADRYSVHTLDYDTRCRYDIVAGIKLSGEPAKAALRECAQASVVAIEPSDLDPNKPAKLAAKPVPEPDE